LDQLAAVEGRSQCARGVRPGAQSTTLKPPKFDGVTSWAVFHRTFDAAAIQNSWKESEKAAHFLSALVGNAADILHTITSEALYEDNIGALPDRLRDHQLAAVYRKQLRPGCKRAARFCKSPH
jgi:hypothetical protein